MNSKSLLFVIGLLCLFSFAAFTQIPDLNRFNLGSPLKIPRPSPAASVSRVIGITDITIEYSSPAVRGREIWGGVVPYGTAPGARLGNGKPYPWRAGANENTTVSFSTDVTIEGQKLAAGKYGFHIIPVETGKWTLIFTRVNNTWGSFTYEKNEDALRVQVSPQSVDLRERLTYNIDLEGQDAAIVSLYWEKIKVPFKVQVDVHETVLTQLRKDLRDEYGFVWQNYYQAANYCARNNLNHEEALAWADKSIFRDENFMNLEAKAALLQQMGRTAEAEATMDRAITLATDVQLARHGNRLMGQEKYTEAMEIYQLNLKRHPDSWNTHFRLANCYIKLGKTKKAKKHYNMALQKLPSNDEFNKTRIAKALQDLS